MPQKENLEQLQEDMERIAEGVNALFMVPEPKGRSVEEVLEDERKQEQVWRAWATGVLGHEPDW